MWPSTQFPLAFLRIASPRKGGCITLLPTVLAVESGLFSEKYIAGGSSRSVQTLRVIAILTSYVFQGMI